MKKALISILIILSLILTMFSCKEPVDTDTDTDTEGNEEQAIQPIYLSKQYYAELLCGEYTGSELKIYNEDGASYYKIFTSAEELIVNTASGNGIPSVGKIFEDNYVVMIATVDFSGDLNPNEKIGYKRISNENGELSIVLDKRNIRGSEESEGEPSCIVPIINYQYVQVPKSALKNFLVNNESHGRINLLVQKFEYVFPTDVLALDNDLLAGEAYIIQGENFDKWASKHFINAKEYGFEVNENEVVICYSLKSPYYGKSRYSSYAIYGGTLTIEREVSSCDAGQSRRFVELIKLPKEEMAGVSTVTFNDTKINIDIIKPTSNAVVTSKMTGKENLGYMVTENLGYYYGTDLSNYSGVYGRVIQSYSELEELVERPEEVGNVFKSYNVLVLKINTNKDISKYCIGFTEYEATSGAVNITLVGKGKIGQEVGDIYPTLSETKYHYFTYITVPKEEECKSNPNIRLSIKTIRSDFEIISNIDSKINHVNGTAWLLKGEEEIESFEAIYNVNIKQSEGSVFAVYIKNSNNVDDLQGYEKLCMHGKKITLTLINGAGNVNYNETEGAPCFVIIPVVDNDIINTFNLELYTEIKEYRVFTSSVTPTEDQIYESGYYEGMSLKEMYGESFKIITSEEEYEAYKAERSAQEENLGLSYVRYLPNVDFESYDIVLIDNNLLYSENMELVYKNAHVYRGILYLHREIEFLDHMDRLWEEINSRQIVEFAIIPKSVLMKMEISQVKVIKENYTYEKDFICDEFPDYIDSPFLENEQIIIP